MCVLYPHSAKTCLLCAEQSWGPTLGMVSALTGFLIWERDKDHENKMLLGASVGAVSKLGGGMPGEVSEESKARFGI